MTFTETFNAAFNCMTVFDRTLVILLTMVIISVLFFGVSFIMFYIMDKIKSFISSKISDKYKKKRSADKVSRRKRRREFWERHHLFIKGTKYIAIAVVGYFFLMSIINGVTCYYEILE